MSGSIAAMKPGADATLDVWRAGKKLNVAVKVTELKEQQQTAKAGGGKQKDRATNQAAQFGLTVRQLDPQEKEQAETQGNLVVEEVTGPPRPQACSRGTSSSASMESASKRSKSCRTRPSRRVRTWRC